MTNYPNSKDNGTSIPGVSGTSDEDNAITALRDAIFAIEDELGIAPSGIYSDVRARLDILESRAAHTSVTSDGYLAIDGYVTIAGSTTGTAASPFQGLKLINFLSAVNGTQQPSSAVIFNGQGWDSTASLSKQVNARNYLVPIQQAGNPSSELTFDFQSNSGSYLTMLKMLSQGGIFIANDSVTPATPTGGGVLYVEGGILKYKGSSGTVTQLALA